MLSTGQSLESIVRMSLSALTMDTRSVLPTRAQAGQGGRHQRSRCALRQYKQKVLVYSRVSGDATPAPKCCSSKSGPTQWSVTSAACPVPISLNSRPTGEEQHAVAAAAQSQSQDRARLIFEPSQEHPVRHCDPGPSLVGRRPRRGLGRKILHYRPAQKGSDAAFKRRASI
jgi:hypothetical protein